MRDRQNRYKTMERNMLLTILGCVALFVAYLIAAGNGIIWLKVVLSILTILSCVLCLTFLYLSDELLKQRSLWMTTAATAILVCLLFSLLLNFPSPNIYQLDKIKDIFS